MQLSILHSCRLKESNEPCYSEGHNVQRGMHVGCLPPGGGKGCAAARISSHQRVSSACRRRPETCFLSRRLTSALLHSVCHCICDWQIFVAPSCCNRIYIYCQQRARTRAANVCLWKLLTFGSTGRTKMLRRDKRRESFWRILTLVLLRDCTFAWLKSSDAYLRPPPVAPRRSTRHQQWRLKTRNGLIWKLIFSKGKTIFNWACAVYGTIKISQTMPF